MKRTVAGPVTVLIAVLVALAVFLSAWVGWLLAGRINVAVGVASVLCAALLLSGLWVLVQVGLLTVTVRPPKWLRRLEETTPVTVPWGAAVQRAINFGAEEARHFHQPRIGTEHLLLGLMREGGDAARALVSLDVTMESLIRAVDFLSGMGKAEAVAKPSLDPAARRILDAAAIRARTDRNRQVETGHVLLAMLDDAQSSAAAILDQFGCTAATITDALHRTRARR